MPPQYITLDGIPIPRFLYGTAWKENETQRLVELALQQGFRGIDTANQRKHYHEAAVGLGMAAAIARGVVTRDDLFLQTKYTYQRGQDDRLPYDPAASVTVQVEQSCASSLQHLGTQVLEAYLLHGPSQRVGLGAADREAWRAMEMLVDRGSVRWLGISNVTLEQLDQLCQFARIQPRFVQNRCYAVQGWDRDVRLFCKNHGILYQGFSLLTANTHARVHPALVKIAARHGRTASQIVFRYALDVGMLPLTGTSSAEHMREDLQVWEFQLDAAEVQVIDELMG